MKPSMLTTTYPATIVATTSRRAAGREQVKAALGLTAGSVDRAVWRRWVDRERDLYRVPSAAEERAQVMANRHLATMRQDLLEGRRPDPRVLLLMAANADGRNWLSGLLTMRAQRMQATARPSLAAWRKYRRGLGPVAPPPRTPGRMMPRPRVPAPSERGGTI